MKEVKVPEHPLPEHLKKVVEGMKKQFEPSVFQKEIFDKIVATPRKTLLWLPQRRPTYIGMDMAESGADKSIIAQVSVDKTGKMFVVFDEYGSFFSHKWYRNPVKWVRAKMAWRALLKSGKEIQVNIDLDKSVKKDGRTE